MHGERPQESVGHARWERLSATEAQSCRADRHAVGAVEAALDDSPSDGNAQRDGLRESGVCACDCHPFSLTACAARHVAGLQLVPGNALVSLGDVLLEHHRVKRQLASSCGSRQHQRRSIGPTRDRLVDQSRDSRFGRKRCLYRPAELRRFVREVPDPAEKPPYRMTARGVAW